MTDLGSELDDGPFKTVDLSPGSLVVEKYRYTNLRGRDTGVQWLAQSVDKDGNLILHWACRTRREAMEVLRELEPELRVPL